MQVSQIKQEIQKQLGDELYCSTPNVPGSKLPMLGMVIPTFVGILIMGYINPYNWIDDHPLSYGNNGSLDSELADRSIHVIMPLPLVGGSKPISQSVSHRWRTPKTN